ncbi:MAG: Peptidase Ste24p [Pedosphaera sp.]|nr:Peptidase Ste24p [Pedosphaera sp.]
MVPLFVPPSYQLKNGKIVIGCNQTECNEIMKNIIRHLIAITGVAAIIILSGCTTAPVTGRKQLSLVSSDQTAQLGLTEFDKMKKEQKIDTDPAHNALVQKVGKRIATVAGKDMPNAQWEFVVFDSPEANAFCLPGGKVGVYSGILPITRDEAGLATVLGHEIAHATAKHGDERMSQQMIAQQGQQLLGSAVGEKSQMTQQLVGLAYGATSQVGVMLPFSRKQESEADHIGLIYMARAGYDPQAAIDFWIRFADYSKQNGGGSKFAFLSDHPVDSVRIEQLKQWQPEAKAAFTQGSTH